MIKKVIVVPVIVEVTATSREAWNAAIECLTDERPPHVKLQIAGAFGTTPMISSFHLASKGVLRPKKFRQRYTRTK